MNEELVVYQKFLYKLSGGNPIKLSLIIENNLIAKNSLTMLLFNDKINVDTVNKKAKQIIKQIKSKN
jgi:hypothetical protein